MNKKYVNLIVSSLLILGTFFVSVPVNAQVDSTDSGKSVRDTLRERVEKRLEQLTNKPKAVIGKITDIRDSSLLVETQDGTKQVKLEDKTIFMLAKKSDKKTISTKDLEIGMNVIAMGFMKTKDVLDAQRILIVDSAPTLKRKVIHGTVQTVGKDSLTVQGRSSGSNNQETWTIEIEKGTKVTAKVDGRIATIDSTSIVVGDRVFVIGTPAKDSVAFLSADIIHVVPGTARGFSAKESPTPKPSATQKSKSTPSPTP